MPGSSRKTPFSGKKKKAQLQEKRQKKAQVSEAIETIVLTPEEVEKFNNEMRGPAPAIGASTATSSAPNSRNTGRGRFQLSNAAKLRTVFEKEPQDFVDQRKVENIPKRPAWTYDMSKEQVEGQEAAMFEKYLDGIYTRFPIRRLNYFEHNLEVWRQLWRVCEVSDALLILADIRHPMFHFPPALYHYVVRDLKKPLILVLTKVDLVPTQNVVKWTQYFTDTFPGLYVCSYTSYEMKSADEEASWTIGTKKKTRRRGKGYTPTGVEAIMDIIRSFGVVKKGRVVPVDYLPPNAQPAVVSLQHVKGSASPSPSPSLSPSLSQTTSETVKSQKVAQSSVNDGEEDPEAIEDEDDDDVMDEVGREEELKRIEEAMNEDHYQPVRESDHLILGLVGNPNVGKSTFINAMKGRKVCSTSRTPGHTKWKQTIFLNKNIMLVDCPGLVFPAVDMPKQLQVLCGIFPIAQVREPFSAIQYMAKYVPIEDVYRLSLADAQDSIKYDPTKNQLPWSAWMLCEAYARKRGYHTRRGLDVHRAGLEILFDVIDGRVVLFFLPNQTSINLGAFTDPDGKICHPLQPKDESDEIPSDPTSTPLDSALVQPDASKDTSQLSSRNTSSTKRTKKQDKLVAVANPRPGSLTDETHSDGESNSDGDDDQDSEAAPERGNDAEAAPKPKVVGNNPFDILG